jgi:hypothetical protein
MESLNFSWFVPDRYGSSKSDELLQLSRLTNLKDLRLDGGNFCITDNVLKDCIPRLTQLEKLYLEYSISSGGDYTKITAEGLAAMLSASSSSLSSLPPFSALRNISLSIGTLDYSRLFTSDNFPSLVTLHLQGGTQYM